MPANAPLAELKTPSGIINLGKWMWCSPPIKPGYSRSSPVYSPGTDNVTYTITYTADGCGAQQSTTGNHPHTDLVYHKIRTSTRLHCALLGVEDEPCSDS